MSRTPDLPHCRVAAYLPTAFEIPVEGSSLHIYTSSPGLYFVPEHEEAAFQNALIPNDESFGH
jgi:hypothetical protein